MPKILRARPPQDTDEHNKIRKLARARHAPGGLDRAGPHHHVELGGGVSGGDRGTAGLSREQGALLDPPVQRRRSGRAGDRPGVGRKRRISEYERGAIIALARSNPPERLVRDAAGELSEAVGDQADQRPGEWTLDALTQVASEAGIDIHRSQVRRIFRAEGVRWRRTCSWATSTDAEFAPKGPASWSSTLKRRRVPR